MIERKATLMDNRETQLAELYGEHKFYKALTHVLAEALLRQNPEPVKQQGHRYAKEAAAEAASWMAEHIPPEWKLDSKYSTLPEDTGIAMANGVTNAQQCFQEHFKRLVALF